MQGEILCASRHSSTAFFLKSKWNGNLCLNYIHTICNNHSLSSTFLKLENMKGALLQVKSAALEPTGLDCLLIILKYLLCFMICIAHKNWKCVPKQSVHLLVCEALGLLWTCIHFPGHGSSWF